MGINPLNFFHLSKIKNVFYDPGQGLANLFCKGQRVNVILAKWSLETIISAVARQQQTAPEQMGVTECQ